MDDTQAELDEIGFIFIGHDERPYKCCLYGGEPWLFYWHPDNHWVTLRKLSRHQVSILPRNLSEEHQAIYNQEHDEWLMKNT